MVPSRLLLLPPVVMAFEKDAAGKAVEMEDKANQIEERVVPEAARLVGKHGGSVATDEKLRECGKVDDCGELLLRLTRWSVAASFEIAAQMKQVRNYGRHSIGEWQFKDDLGSLRASLNADFVATVILRDLSDTTGRAVLNFVGGVHTSFKQVGVACVTDLRDGRMINCAVRSDRWGDLLAPGQAERAIDDLLSEIFGVPRSAPKQAEVDSGPRG